MKIRRFFALCVVLTLMISLVACSSVTGTNKNGSIAEPNENSSIAGPSGIYANKDIYYVYEFNGNKCHSGFLLNNEGNDGTWKFDETDKNKIIVEFDDGVDPLTYDAEADTLSLGGVTNFEKVSDEEYGELKKSAMELQSAMDSLNDKPTVIEYFSECPSMPTPDSAIKGITFGEKEEAGYTYYLGTDIDEAAAAMELWENELTSRNFDVGIYDENDIFYIKKDGKYIALFSGGSDDDGYWMVVSFF